MRRGLLFAESVVVVAVAVDAVVAESFAAGASAFVVAWTACQTGGAAAAATVVLSPAFEPEAPAIVEFEADSPIGRLVFAAAAASEVPVQVVVVVVVAAVVVVAVIAAAVSVVVFAD